MLRSNGLVIVCAPAPVPPPDLVAAGNRGARRPMKALYAVALIVALAITSAACNKHDVPMGGACDVNEDCGKGTLACYKPPGQDKGYCSQTCTVAPPAGLQPGGPGCESAGLVCKKADVPHRLLGEEFCVRP